MFSGRSEIRVVDMYTLELGAKLGRTNEGKKCSAVVIMKQSKIMVYTMLFLLLLCIGLLLLWHLWPSSPRDGFSTDFSRIPSTIWAYWDGDVPPLVQKCIQSWKKHNPTYEIIVLNKGSLSKYLPKVDFAKMKHVNDSVQRFSDFVRVHVLAEHGGMWIDASTICQAPLDWIQKIQQQDNVEFVGYFTYNMTLPKWRDASPALENWAFACVPHSQFMQDWRDEMMKITTYDHIKEYSRHVVQNENIDPQRIPGAPDDIDYFAMHLAAQRVLQPNPNKYRLHLQCAEETALRYLCEPGSNDIVRTEETETRFAQRLIQREFPNEPLLKLPGFMRDRVEQWTDDYTFVLGP